MKSSENNCKQDELAGFVSALPMAVDAVDFGVLLIFFDASFWPSLWPDANDDDDLYGVDVKILPSILLPTVDDDDGVFDQTDESALNVLNALADCNLLALPLLYQPSFGDKSCGRNKLAEHSADPKLSIEWFKMDDDGESQMLWPLEMAGDWICGGVYQTDDVLESLLFRIINVDCGDSFNVGLSHRFDGVDVDFLNWPRIWSRWALFGDDCVDAQSISLLALVLSAL